MALRNDALSDDDLVYYFVELYKTDDCTGVAHVNGIGEKNGALIGQGERYGNKWLMRG